MSGYRTVTDLEECRHLWQQVMPEDQLTDLWEVRQCFQEHFRRPPLFIAAEEYGKTCGLLPLSWIEESGCYGYFPGETWEGKTWLEGNRVFSRDGDILAGLINACPSPFYLRYLTGESNISGDEWATDEIGYLFLPPAYGYDMENYFHEFSNKGRKRLRKEMASIESLGVEYRTDDLSDLDILAGLNRKRFGDRSYFSDVRFMASFRSLARLLDERGLLRMTTLLVGGRPAAVDMGCVYKGTYTLLAGGTVAAYPGVAKLINLHHMERACRERLDQVDFLCGDFAWKPRFHLAPRPLYLLSGRGRSVVSCAPGAMETRASHVG